MTIYLQKSRPVKRGGLFYSLLISVFVTVFVIGLQIFAGQFLERVAMSLGGPFSSTYLSLKERVGHIRAFYHSRLYLVDENRRLRATVEENREKVYRLDSLLLEHGDLLSAYGRNQFHATGTLMLANVLSKPPQSPYDILLIDIGSDHNLVEGQQVFSLGGIPAGRISEVSGSTAKVVLFSSVGEETKLTIERTGETVSVEGRGGGNLETEVGQEMDIVVGDRIVLPQFNAAVVASVVEVEVNPTSAFKRVFFHSAINVFKLRWVEVAPELFVQEQEFIPEIESETENLP